MGRRTTRTRRWRSARDKDEDTAVGARRGGGGGGRPTHDEDKEAAVGTRRGGESGGWRATRRRKRWSTHDEDEDEEAMSRRTTRRLRTGRRQRSGRTSGVRKNGANEKSS